MVPVVLIKDDIENNERILNINKCGTICKKTTLKENKNL